MQSLNEPNEPKTISGRWLVVGMFAFGFAITGSIWVYWNLHVAPFLPFQNALAAEFEDSRPRVEGGQRKMHQQTPHILRITMKVDFNPVKEGRQFDEFINRLVEFTQANFDLKPYDELEIHTYWPEPEKEIRQRSITLKVLDLRSTTEP